MAGLGFRIYIDDSGEKEYGEKTSRYFVYAGVAVERQLEQGLSDEIDALKVATFRTAAVEIKSNWLRIPKERQARYLGPFAIQEAELLHFVEQLYGLMRSDRMTYVAAAIDKVQMVKKYGKNAHYPSALAYLFILQRYEKHCSKFGGSGYVTIDDMSGSSPKKNHWRDLLRTQHERLKKDGCQFTKMKFDRLAPRPLFANSASLNLLQVADLVAYNVYRQFRDYGEAWDMPGSKSVPLYPRLGAVIHRFMLGINGRLTGWGIVKYPTVNPLPWRLRPKGEK